MAANTSDIAQLLDALPEDSAAFGTFKPEGSGTSTQGSSSGRSSAGGSGNSSPLRETVDDVADEVVEELVPPAPLAGQPSNDELDMWEVLMSLDGAPGSADVATPTHPPKLPKPSFAKPLPGVLPETWAEGAAAFTASLHPPQQPTMPPTPLKPASSRKSPVRSSGGVKGDATKPAKPPQARKAAAAARPATQVPPPPPPAAASLLPEPAAAPAPSQEIPLRGTLDMSAIEAELAKGPKLASDGEEEVPDDETPEQKRMRRMRRNRESAAMSRNRKKMYVEELEAQLAQMQQVMSTLQSENFELRRECARIKGVPVTASPSAAEVESDSFGALRPPLPDDMPSLEEGLVALAPEDLIAPILVEPPASSEVPFVALAAPTGVTDPVPAAGSAGAKRAGSPLLGGSAKRASAASLALMSCVTLVTLSVSGAVPGGVGASGLRNSRGHSPTARMLMSLTEAALPWSRPAPAAFAMPERRPEAASDGAGSLWPSLGLGGDASIPSAVDAAISPPPAVTVEAAVTHASHSVAPTAAPRGYAERVIRAPSNSSWADVLRIEAAEKRLAEAQLALRELSHLRRGAADGAAAAAGANALPHPTYAPDHLSAYEAAAAGAPRQRARHSATMHDSDGDGVFEPVDEDDTDGADGPLLTGAEYDAQRFIFCSRAYMFDAAVRRPGTSPRPPSPLDHPKLPEGMPARFRDGVDYRQQQQQQQQQQQAGAVSNLQRISDGGNATPSPSDARRPVVTLLLPSAALSGVVGAERPADGAGATSAESLMQVQCQVLNASRFTAGA